jgi:hypothetical protein
MRAAKWFRESTAGQWDSFGPDAQREQQDRAIERYQLVDAGLEYSVAASGWTSAWRTATWEAMIGSATSGAFDVLVVGYVSRFLRNLKQTLFAVEDHLHTAGVNASSYPPSCGTTGGGAVELPGDPAWRPCGPDRQSGTVRHRGSGEHASG